MVSSFFSLFFDGVNQFFNFSLEYIVMQRQLLAVNSFSRVREKNLGGRREEISDLYRDIKDVYFGGNSLNS